MPSLAIGRPIECARAASMTASRWQVFTGTCRGRAGGCGPAGCASRGRGPSRARCRRSRRPSRGVSAGASRHVAAGLPGAAHPCARLRAAVSTLSATRRAGASSAASAAPWGRAAARADERLAGVDGGPMATMAARATPPRAAPAAAGIASATGDGRASARRFATAARRARGVAPTAARDAARSCPPARRTVPGPDARARPTAACRTTSATRRRRRPRGWTGRTSVRKDRGILGRSGGSGSSRRLFLGE